MKKKKFIVKSTVSNRIWYNCSFFYDIYFNYISLLKRTRYTASDDIIIFTISVIVVLIFFFFFMSTPILKIEREIFLLARSLKT